MKKYFELIKNTGLFALASMAGKLISFFFLPLYTYYLSTEQYAIVDLSNVIQALVWPVISLSIAEALLRFALDKNQNKSKVFTNACLVVVTGLILVICIIPFIKFNNDLDKYKIYFILYFLTMSLNSFFSVFSRTIGKVKLMAINSTISTFIIVLFNILLLVVFKLGLKGYFTALIIGNGVAVLNYVVFSQAWNYFSFRCIDRTLLKKMIIYSLPLIPNAIFWWINSSLDKAFLMSMMGLSEVGLYSVAGKIPSILNMVTSVFQQAWGISSIEEFEEDGDGIFFTNIFKIYSFVILICTALIIALTKALSTFLFSNQFYEAWYIVPILLLAFYYASINIYYGSIFTASRNTKIILYTTGAGAIINFILNYFMILKFGMIGAAIATCISNFTVYIIRAKMCNEIIKIKINPIVEIISQMLLVFLIINVESINSTLLSAFVIFLIIIMRKDTIGMLTRSVQKLNKIK